MQIRQFFQTPSASYPLEWENRFSVANGLGEGLTEAQTFPDGPCSIGEDIRVWSLNIKWPRAWTWETWWQGWVDDKKERLLDLRICCARPDLEELPVSGYSVQEGSDNQIEDGVTVRAASQQVAIPTQLQRGLSPSPCEESARRFVNLSGIFGPFTEG